MHVLRPLLFFSGRRLRPCSCEWTPLNHIISGQNSKLSASSIRSANRHSSSYLAVDSTHTAVGRFRSLVQRSGTRCLTSSEIRRVVLTVLNSFLRQSSLVSTNVTGALEVFLNDMRYINPRFTYNHHSASDLLLVCM